MDEGGGRPTLRCFGHPPVPMGHRSMDEGGAQPGLPEFGHRSVPVRHLDRRRAIEDGPPPGRLLAHEPKEALSGAPMVTLATCPAAP
jgi:hypothetical protein